MKSLLMLIALSSAGIEPAMAHEGRLIEVSGPSVMVVMPGRAATVQPSAFITVHFASCMKRNLIAETEIVNGTEMLVSIYDLEEKDCRGRAIDRAYELQISSDFGRDYQVKLMNPLALSHVYPE